MTALAAIAWLAAGFVIAAIAGAALLLLLPRLQFRQTAYEDAPKTHAQKTGTPTMGGIVFALALLALLAVREAPFVGALLVLVLGCAFVGFVDDLLGILRGKNAGLSARTKYLATAFVAVVFLRIIASSDSYFPRDTIFHAGTYALTVPYWLWLLLGIVAVTGTVHAVNLADGLDGLATGTVVPPLAVFAAIGAAGAVFTASHAALLGVGACFGFLLYNRHKAKMFMGDVGSLGLGALLAGCAILTGEMLLLVLAGGVFVAEALSVILQVTYFKATKGKRIFRMTPLHHHFELLGWRETRVTLCFWLASLACAAIAWAVTR